MDGKQFRDQIEAATDLVRAGAGSFIGRRGLLQLAVGAATYAVTETFTRTVVDPALEPSGPHMATDTSVKALESMDRAAPVRIAAEAWKERPSIDHVISALGEAGYHDRHTVAALDSLDRLCITCQGDGARRLWGFDLVGMPMGERPEDPGMGEFLHDRYRQALGSDEMILQNVVLFPKREDLPRRFRYVGFAAAEGRRVIGVTVPSERARSGSDDSGPVRQEPSFRPAARPQRTTRQLGVAV